MNRTHTLHCNACGGAVSLTDDYLAQYGGQSTQCPNCGAAFPIPLPAAVDAPGPPPPPPVALGYAGQPVLQYASPSAYAVVAVWRDAGGLVMAKGAVGPDRCVKCNAPAEGYLLTRKLSWHPPLLFFLILFPGLLIYAIVALCVQKKGQVTVGVCPVHRRARARNALIAWGSALLGAGLFTAALVVNANTRWPDDSTFAVVGIVAGLLLLAFGAFYGVVAVPIVTARKIDDRYVYLNRAGRAFLDTLPRF
ncbi:MAG TPA: hypothetical protein VMZ71_03200 [Gemmataceae bacterium]|nr:hypothetical protein [Gemmataceae bacterium]